MYRTSSHEPRYKHTTRKGRHDDSENSTSEEDDESTDCRTEESDETVDTRGSESIRKESLYSADSSYHQGRQYGGRRQSSFTTAHVCHSKILKHDKITQKNLLSPFPSFTIPPIYRELGGPLHRGSPIRVREKHTEARLSPKPNPRRKDSFDDKEESVCYIHKISDRKSYDKHRSQKDHHSRSNRSERILTCVNTSTTGDPAGKSSVEIPPVTESTQLPPMVIRRPKTADRDTVASSKCQDMRGRSRRKSMTAASLVVDHLLPAEAIPPKGKRNRKVAGDGSGEVREKLVYVVEEKGKDVTKLETDLFTLNEILAIKKDLVELSEFAKKLKKLKEMKRESDAGAENPQNACHCKTAADLLKDVNKRIEALEARQEELERGKTSEQKVDTETDSKKAANGKKASLDSQSKAPVAMKESAMTTNPSFPKMGVFMSRTDNLSNNSDIVNELMDIKTQLHKLEQKRMSKGAMEEASPGEDSKPAKLEDPAIAVFSSRTYILTDNFDKRKQEIKASVEEKPNNYFSPVGEAESRKEQTKEHVANWLKSVSPKTQENGYPPPSGPKREENSPRGSDRDRKSDLRCKNCAQTLKPDDFPNQEPQKNRATDKDGRVESDSADQKKTDSPGKLQMKYKECIVTASGKIFTCVNSSSGRISADTPEVSRPKSARGLTPQQSPENDRTESSCSVPSAVQAKETVRKLKEDIPKRRDLLPRIIKTKSVVGVSGNSTKSEKTARNTKLKNINKMAHPKDKKHKDGKNQCLKLLEAHLVALRKTLKKGGTSTSSCTNSEFLASVNLDTVSTSETSRLQGSGDNRAQRMVVAYPAAVADEEVVEFDNCETERRLRRMLKEEERRKKQRELECRKMLKKKLKEQKKCELAERKRKKEQHKCELKQLKQRCRELNYCDPIEECLAKKKSLENCVRNKRSANTAAAPRKSRSSEEFAARKSYYAEEPSFKRSYSSEGSGGRRRHRSQDDRARKYYLEPQPGQRHQQYEEEHLPRKYRYDDEECDDRYREEAPRRYYGKEEPSRRYYIQEEPPRRYYPNEEVSRRYYDNEQVPRRRYDNDKISTRQYCKEDLPNRQYDKEDVTRMKRCEEEKNAPRKLVCEEVPKKTPYSPREKPYKGEYQKSSEDKSTASQCGKTDNAMQLLRKRQEEELRKMKFNMDKQSVENCRLKNVVKNLGKLKINIPFAGEFCDGKHTKCKKSTTPEPPEKCEKPDKEKRRDDSDERFQWGFSMYEDEEDDEDEDCDDDDDDDEDEWRHHYRTNPDRNEHHRQMSYPYYEDGRTDLQGNCRCVRVFLQSQVQNGWSGLRPFQKLCTDSVTEGTTSKTPESSKSVKSGFAVPKIQMPIFHVGCVSEEKDCDQCKRDCKQCKPEYKQCKRDCKELKRAYKQCKKDCKECKKDCKRDCKQCKKECKKHKRDEKCREKCRKKHRKKHKDDHHCMCRRCGNVHQSGHHDDPVRCRDSPIMRRESPIRYREQALPCGGPPPPPPDAYPPVKPQGKSETEGLPLFSFLSQFCKPKPRDPKSATFAKKLGEVPNLKMCATPQRTPIDHHQQPNDHHQLPKPSNTCCTDENNCKCRPILAEIESRLSMLENVTEKCTEECCKKNKKKKKKKKKCDCSEFSSDSAEHRRRESCNKNRQRRESNERHRRESCERRRREGDGRHRQKNNYCNDECCDGGKPPPKPCETAAYYQTIYYPSGVNNQNNSSFSVMSKSSSEDEKESTGTTKSKEVPPQKVEPPKDGLSSLHSFWKNLRKYRITNGRNGMECLMKKIRRKKSACLLMPDITLVDGLSKGSPLPCFRQVTEARTCGRSKDKEGERKEKKKSRSCRKRHT